MCLQKNHLTCFLRVPTPWWPLRLAHDCHTAKPSSQLVAYSFMTHWWHLTQLAPGGCETPFSTLLAFLLTSPPPLLNFPANHTREPQGSARHSCLPARTPWVISPRFSTLNTTTVLMTTKSVPLALTSPWRASFAHATPKQRS